MLQRHPALFGELINERYLGLESILLQTEVRYASFFGLDRSTSVSRVRELHAMGFGDGEFESIPERWHLQNLCVSGWPSCLPAPINVPIW